MMRRTTYMLILSLLFVSVGAEASLRVSRLAADTLESATPVVADSLMVQDSLTAADTVMAFDTAAAAALAEKFMSQEVNQAKSGLDTVILSSNVNALEYMRQKRWQPVDRVEFTNDYFRDNLFVSFRLGGVKPLDKNFGFGPSYGVSVGKWLAPAHALRLNFSGGHYSDNSLTKTYVNYSELSLSYLFNMMPLLYGFNPERFCEVSVVAGIGGGVQWEKPKVGGLVGAHVGLNFNLNVGRNVDVFFEPLFKIGYDGLGFRRFNNWKGYYSYFDGQVGVSLRVPTYESFGANSFDEQQSQWFFYAGASTQYQHSAAVRALSTIESLGWSAEAGFGKYVGKCSSIRFGVNCAGSPWLKSFGDRLLWSEYYGANFDLLLDIVALCSGFRRGFSASILAGPAAGCLIKNDIEKSDRVVALYIGADLGVQLKARVGGPVSIFLEPICSFYPYRAKNFSASYNPLRNHYDALIRCNIGIEVAL